MHAHRVIIGIVSVGALAAPSLAQFDVIATTGDPAPGGGTYEAFLPDGASLGPNDEVLFIGDVASGVVSVKAILIDELGAREVFAEGAVVPPLVTPRTLLDAPMPYGADGAILRLVPIPQPGFTTPDLAFGAPGALEIVVAGGLMLDGQTLATGTFDFAHDRVNGWLVLMPTFDAPGDPEPALYRRAPGTGVLTRLLANDAPSPDADGVIRLDHFRTEIHGIAPDGTVATMIDLRDPEAPPFEDNFDPMLVRIDPDGSVHIVERGNQPDAGEPQEDAVSLNNPAIGAGRHVAWVRRANQDQQLKRYDPDGSERVLLTQGDPVPASDGTPNNDTVSFFSRLSVDEAGNILVSVAISTPDPSIPRALVLASPDGARTIVRDDDATPEPTGSSQREPGTIEINTRRRAVINARGQVAFVATVHEPTKEIDALFYWDDERGLIEVAREGDTIDAGEIEHLTFASREGSVRQLGLGETGSLAFHVALVGGTELILKWSPPSIPEDWNNDGFVNAQDFFDFVNDYFDADDTNADFNGDGFENGQDWFDFVNAFFD